MPVDCRVGRLMPERTVCADERQQRRATPQSVGFQRAFSTEREDVFFKRILRQAFRCGVLLFFY